MVAPLFYFDTVLIYYFIILLCCEREKSFCVKCYKKAQNDREYIKNLLKVEAIFDKIAKSG